MGSEIALLQEQIEQEYDAVHSGLHGLASGTARHVFMHTRMHNIELYHRRLRALVGESAADDVLCVVHDKSYLRWVRKYPTQSPNPPL